MMIINNLVKKFSKIIDGPVCNIIDFNYIAYKYKSLKAWTTFKIRLTFNKESGFGFRVFEDYNDHIEHDIEYGEFEDAFKDFVERCSKFNIKLSNNRK